ncbi:GNAT family N-acetyltransferase [Demequina sp. NBRC 110056]|uniref:GNAT family N-acetyltransferase n=1 Tax=Demequina sp. NBRC 110056 TaxID=1570345 RepID=UPI000A061356|nr:GNAT family N-acetyltransferase [Demequina sp. NBRC 110056]
MAETIRIVDPSEGSRLTEIGQLTALAYLADGLVDQAHPYIPQLKDAHARAQDADLLMMVDGEDGSGPVVGTITLVPPGSSFVELARDDEYELRMLAVSPIERGRGIGAKLTQTAMDMAVERGASRIVLSTMESMHVAHRLYERMGFTRREDLDWTVVDNADGSVSRLSRADAEQAERAGTAIHLLGYSWEP